MAIIRFRQCSRLAIQASMLGWVLIASSVYAANQQRFHPSPIRNIAALDLKEDISLKVRRNAVHQPRTSLLEYHRGGGATSKATDFRNRTLSAIFMLGSLVAWLRTFREKGLIALVLFVQVGLFREGTDVVLTEKEVQDKNRSSIRWWWFTAYNLALVGPRLLPALSASSPYLSTSSIYLCSFAMIAMGIISFVVTLNNSIAFSYEFRLALKEVALYHLAIVLLVVPTSFWIGSIQDFGMSYVLYALYLVIINDTMAYLFGVTFGKHPLLPTISPKKSWEGFLGALMTTMSVSTVLWRSMELQGGSNSVRHALIIAAYCSLVAPFGGFLASIVKRAYGKKDFSNMIAGHGGFIDRLDCQVVTAPFLYLYLKRFVFP